MSYSEARERYAAIGVDAEAALSRLKTVPVALHCWQGDDVRGFDTDPSKPLTGGIQTTGSYPGRARTPDELMDDLDLALRLCPGTKKLNLHASYAIFAPGEWVSMGVADRTLAGEYFITSGIRHRLRHHAHNRKGCQICVLALSAGQGQIRQTISDENLRAIAQSFGVQLNEVFLSG